MGSSHTRHRSLNTERYVWSRVVLGSNAKEVLPKMSISSCQWLDPLWLPNTQPLMQNFGEKEGLGQIRYYTTPSLRQCPRWNYLLDSFFAILGV